MKNQSLVQCVLLHLMTDISVIIRDSTTVTKMNSIAGSLIEHDSITKHEIGVKLIASKFVICKWKTLLELSVIILHNVYRNFYYEKKKELHD